MTNEIPEANEAAAAKQLPTRHYRKFAPPSKLTREQCRRQTDVLRAACEHVVPSGAAITFLNSYNQVLGGSPLELALQSEDGLERVAQHLASMARLDPQQGAQS